MSIAPPSRRSFEDHLAFESLFRRYYKELVGFFRNRGLEAEEAEDLTQDTLAQVYRHIGGFRGDANLRTWVFSIAWNLWRNSLRHRGTLKRAAETISVDGLEEGALEPELPRDSGEDPLISTLAREQRELLKKQVESLPPQMRECLTRYIYGGQKYQEIADALGLSLNTVKSSISQSKTRLRRQLHRAYPELQEWEKGGDA